MNDSCKKDIGLITKYIWTDLENVWIGSKLVLKEKESELTWICKMMYAAIENTFPIFIAESKLDQ